MMLLGVRIDDVDRAEMDQRLLSWLNGFEPNTVATPNPEMLLLARKDAAFRELLNQSDMNVPDGVGLRFAASALTNERLVNRHTGVDVLTRLAALCAMHGRRLMLFGGGPRSADAAAGALKNIHPNLDVVAMDPGPVDENGRSSLFFNISALKPDVLAVALGHGKQERFIHQAIRHVPSIRIAIGVGGAFEMLGGHLRRSPAWMRRTGLEWAWRLLLQPKRARRIGNATIVFPAVVVWSTLKSRTFLRACRNVFPEILRQLRGL
jgi:N-acetylglucosaminyldiphosphoundecaprenol N-acetyl-beta-D-mannosaminyltransferase